MFEHTTDDISPDVIRNDHNVAVTDLRYDKSAIFGGKPTELHYRGYRCRADRARGARILARQGAHVMCYQDTQAAFALQVWPNAQRPGVTW